MADDACFDRADVEVADDDERDVPRHVFARVERAQRRAGGCVERFGRADGKAPGIAGLGVEELRRIEAVAIVPCVAVAHFRQDYAALAVDGALGNREVARGFAHQHQCGVQQDVIGARQVQLVDGPIEAGRGVGIGAEGEPVALQQLDHFAFGHTLGAVEGHVLDEVGISQFTVGLVERSRVHDHAHHGGAGRRRVVAHDVAHAIVQPSEAEVRIDGNVAVLESPGTVLGNLLRGQRRGGQRHEDGNQKTSHCQTPAREGSG